MPHFFVDDAFGDSKEVMAIPTRHRNAAIGLWTRCGAWSASKLTDGVVPMEVVRMFGGRTSDALVTALVAVDLWILKGDRIVFRNWAKWQRTRAQVCAYREAQAEKKRRQRGSTKDHPTSVDAKMSPGDNPRDRNPRPQGTPQTPIPKPTPIPNNSGNQSSELTLVSAADAEAATPGAELVRRIVPREQPDAVKTVLRVRASELIRAGHSTADVSAALELWLAKPHLGPNTLPSLLSEVMRSRNRPNGHAPPNGVGKPTLKALGYQTLADELIAEMDKP